MTSKMKNLLNELEGVRTTMESLLDDETVYTLPKAYSKLKDSFDYILQGIEDGNYDEERDE